MASSLELLMTAEASITSKMHTDETKDRKLWGTQRIFLQFLGGVEVITMETAARAAKE